MEDTPEIIAVELVPHRAEWAGMAKAEGARLKATLGDVLLAVHHIGSTSIPDILAKPIVDISLAVTDLNALDAKEEDVRALGYRWLGEFGIPGRRFCTLKDHHTGKRTYQLHFFEQDNPELTRHIAYRDYLLTHPDVAKAYEAEKIRAAKAKPNNTIDYNAEKNDWIKHTEKKASAWFAQRMAEQH
jgi:GrpB-like predicted nucleotidyltransferase (UPF0157 family)